MNKLTLGDNNPSKRPEVRKILSESKMGDLNPARKYREQYAAHIAKFRPGKVSKLEDAVANFLPKTLERQFKVNWYSIDFANEKELIAVEIQGCWHHSCKICFPSSPSHPTQYKNCANDKRKHSFLKNRNWKIIELWEHEIRNVTKEEILEIFQERLDYDDEV
jgi:very-short-patch-repair endonuclease